MICLVRCQCVVARRPSSRPASARTKAPEQTLATRTPRLATARTKASVFGQLAAVRTPSPPATINVVIALEGVRPRASISTPEVLRTGPGVAANVLIAGVALDRRAAISNTEIGPAASSNWKSGKISTPIMAKPQNLYVPKGGKYGISDKR